MQRRPMEPDSANDSSDATSMTLVGRVQCNDEDAWQRLVDLYGPLIFAWGRRGGLSAEDAADVMQDVFTSVARSIDRFDLAGRGRFRGWLWTITRNKIRDHYRRAEQAAARGGDTAHREICELPERWFDDDSDVTRSEVRSLFHRALDLIRGDFQAQTWEAFWRSAIEDQPTDQIAEQLGLSANGVRQAKSRVLRRLRTELGEFDR